MTRDPLIPTMNVPPALLHRLAPGSWRGHSRPGGPRRAVQLEAVPCWERSGGLPGRSGAGSRAVRATGSIRRAPRPSGPAGPWRRPGRRTCSTTWAVARPARSHRASSQEPPRWSIWVSPARPCFPTRSGQREHNPRPRQQSQQRRIGHLSAGQGSRVSAVIARGFGLPRPAEVSHAPRRTLARVRLDYARPGRGRSARPAWGAGGGDPRPHRAAAAAISGHPSRGLGPERPGPAAWAWSPLGSPTVSSWWRQECWCWSQVGAAAMIKAGGCSRLPARRVPRRGLGGEAVTT
jgi:hypothetical protein